MEIRNFSLAIEFPPGEAGLRQLGRLVARLRNTRGIVSVSASGDKASLRLSVDAAQFSSERLEYELSAFGVRLKSPIYRRILVLKRLDAPEIARAIMQALNAMPGVLLASLDFAAAQGRVEYLASVSPDRLLEAIARFGAQARFADAPDRAASASPFLNSRGPVLLALIAAIALWTGGAVVSALALPRSGFSIAPYLFGAAVLCAGWRPLCAAFRCLRRRALERGALLAVFWCVALAALGHWSEAAGGLIVLQTGELALASALQRFRLQWRDLPPASRELSSLSLAPSNPYAALLERPALRGFFGVLLIAAAFWIAPRLLIPGVTAQEWREWAYRGLVLLPLGSSECFFAAASVAAAVALRSGTDGGLWFRGGAALKNLAGAKAAAYAKTGVLTQGHVHVVDTVPYYGWTGADVLRVAAVLQPDRRHPIARALAEAAAPYPNPAPLKATDCVASEGAGVAGMVEDIRFFLGSRRWMQSCRVPLMRQAEEAIASAEAQGLSVSLLGVEGGLLGLIVFRDKLRDAAPQSIAILRDLGLAPLCLVSGDGASVTARMALELTLDATESSFGELERKARMAEIRERTDGPVLAIGDGAFDSALLDAADAGFCMNAAERPNAALFATVTAQEGDFAPLTQAILLSRRMDAALFRAWGVLLNVRVALLFAALTLPLPLPSLVFAEALAGLMAARYLLWAVPMKARQRETTPVPAKPVVPATPAKIPPPPVKAPKPEEAPALNPPQNPSAARPAKNAAPVKNAPAFSPQTSDSPTSELEPIAIPEPLLELVFVCDPSADEEPTAYRVYPQWESFAVPFYGEPLRFGRKSLAMSLAVQVEDEGVSRLQGEIRLEDRRPVVVDLHSSNGIRHNSKARKALIPTETPTPVKFGDTLYVGRNTRIEVRAPK